MPKMTRITKVFIWIVIIVLLLIGGYYVTTPIITGNILAVEPRKPKLEVVETAEIGWWAYQEALTIDSFRVEFVESNLNLFNSKSLIQYTVKGKLSNDKYWRPSVAKVHVSQRFLRQYAQSLYPYLDSDTIKTPEAMIELTPVVDVIRDENYNGEEIAFEFTNELKIESFHWGNNGVRLQCAEQWQDVILEQRK